MKTFNFAILVAAVLFSSLHQAFADEETYLRVHKSAGADVPAVTDIEVGSGMGLASLGDGSVRFTAAVAAESDPIVGAVNGIVKADGAGNISAAAAGTDYVASESDPVVSAKIGTLTSGNFCKGTGTQVSCTDSSTYLIAETDPNALLLNQSTPQTITGGIPVFNAGLASNGVLASKAPLGSSTYPLWISDGNNAGLLAVQTSATGTAGTVTVNPAFLEADFAVGSGNLGVYGWAIYCSNSGHYCYTNYPFTVNSTLGFKGGTWQQTTIQGGSQAGNIAYRLPETNANGFLYNTGGNWDWLGAISSAGINWTDVDAGEMQRAGINWDSVLNSDIPMLEASGMNWDSLSQNIQSAGINWLSIVNSELQNVGLNWASVTTADMSSSGVNWNDLGILTGGSQTPWESNIDAAGYDLTELNDVLFKKENDAWIHVGDTTSSDTDGGDMQFSAGTAKGTGLGGEITIEAGPAAVAQTGGNGGGVYIVGGAGNNTDGVGGNVEFYAGRGFVAASDGKYLFWNHGFHSGELNFNLLGSDSIIYFPSGGLVPLFTDYDPDVSYIASFDSSALTEDRTYSFPDASGEIAFNKKTVYMKVLLESDALTTGDGKQYVIVPAEMNGMNLTRAEAAVYAASSSGAVSIMIRNVTDAQDMLSTAITIDESETTSYTAATPSVVNASYDDVATGDKIAVDVDGAGTGVTGLDVILSFEAA